MKLTERVLIYKPFVLSGLHYTPLYCKLKSQRQNSMKITIHQENHARSHEMFFSITESPESGSYLNGRVPWIRICKGIQKHSCVTIISHQSLSSSSKSALSRTEFQTQSFIASAANCQRWHQLSLYHLSIEPLVGVHISYLYVRALSCCGTWIKFVHCSYLFSVRFDRGQSARGF